MRILSYYTMMQSAVLGKQLQHWRTRRCWTMGALAAHSGISKASLSRWESGKVFPRLAELDRVLKALEVPASESESFYRLLNAPRAIERLKSAEADYPVSGDLLRVMRLRKGWTQAETAGKVGVRQATLSKWERSEDWPDEKRLHHLCFTLDALPDEIVSLCQGRFLPPLFSEYIADRAWWTMVNDVLDTINRAMQAGELIAGDLMLMTAEATLSAFMAHDREAHLALGNALSMRSWYWQIHGMPFDDICQLTDRAVRVLSAPEVYGPMVVAPVILKIQHMTRQEALTATGRVRCARQAFRQLSGYLPLLDNDPEKKAWVLMEMARQLALQGEEHAEEAVLICQASNQVSWKLGDRREQTISQLYSARILILAKRYDAAAALLYRNGKHDSPTQSMERLLLQAELAALTGDRTGAATAFAAAERILATLSGAIFLRRQIEKVRPLIFPDAALPGADASR